MVRGWNGADDMSITPNEFEVRESLLSARDAITRALCRGSKADRLALFALCASILAPGEDAATKGRITADFLSPGCMNDETLAKIA
jgi:hypothetical protein